MALVRRVSHSLVLVKTRSFFYKISFSSLPAHCKHRFGILDYEVVSHPEHHVEHVDRVILVKLAFGVFEVCDAMNTFS